ncbi:MAG: hypothetical protein ACE5G0_01995 [Rhodothermales bacterium]
MKTLELKRPEAGVLSARKHSDVARTVHSGGAMRPPLYVSWGDHPQAMQPIRLTEPCIPCCTTL